MYKSTVFHRMRTVVHCLGGPCLRKLALTTPLRVRQLRQLECQTDQALLHTPVLLNAILDVFEGQELKMYLDCTLGAAGHASAIIQQHPELEHVIGVDADAVAIDSAKSHLEPLMEHSPTMKTHFLTGNFKDLVKLMMRDASQLLHLLNGGIDGIVMDLGMSSLQLDDAERGFSFMKDGPLDMRMDQQAHTTAAEIVNTWSAFELGALFRDYGEERQWKRIAQRICQAREEAVIETTQQLVAAIGPQRFPKKRSFKKPIHPATKIFQALRIAVNDELGALQSTLPLLIESLSAGGHLCVISFHSLEDRIVKRAFLAASGQLQGVSTELTLINDPPRNTIDRIALGQVLTKKPIVPNEEETERNARSRSAKLRVFQRALN